LREAAEIAWRLASSLPPVSATKFLEAYTAYNHTEEEQDYLRFYFNIEMEKRENE
jgi:hypothetical protein